MTEAIPPLVDAVLDAAKVRALLTDLSLLQPPPEATCKRRMHVQGSDAITLAEVTLLLAQRTAVQFRYRYDSQDWCDTLLPLADGQVRLIRISTTTAVALAAAAEAQESTVA